MTSRTVSVGSGSTPYQRVAICSGDDGKYETFQNQQRLKWNNYSADITICHRSSGTSVQTGLTWWDSNRSYPSQFDANDELTVQSRLSEAVKGSEFNLAVSAAQGKQTVNMVVSAVTAIGGAIHDLKRGRFESAARRFGVAQRPSKLSEKDISGRWLELQYGWLPLISDVHEAAKAYEALTSKARVMRFNESVSRSFIRDASNSPLNYSCKGTSLEKMRIIYEATELLSTPRILGLTDPASVVWELIPYSFVVDWFLPIGSYLANLNTIPKLQGRFLTIKTRKFAGSTQKVNLFPQWNPMPKTDTYQFKMTRVVSTSLTVPKPVFVSLPDAMSPSRIYNAVALVVQRIR